MPTKIEFYAQLAKETAVEITKSHTSWLSFLSTAATIYKYPYNEQILIHAQRPDATACASYDIWNKYMGRYVRRGAQGIALLDSSGDYPKVKYIFDVSDTVETARSRSPNLWQYQQEHESAVRSALDNAYGVGGITLSDQLEETARFEIDDYWYAHKSEILYNIESSILQDYDEDTIRQCFCEAASVSTGYILLKRCGLEERTVPQDFMAVMDFNTPDAVSALGCAVSNTSEDILRQIEAAVKTYEKEKASERSQSNEQPELHSKRRLSNSRPEAEQSQSGASGRIREDAQSIPAGASANPLEQHDSQRDLISPSAGDSAGSREQAVRDDAGTAADSGRNRGAETAGSHEMDRPDEYAEGSGRGSDSEGTDLQLESQVSFFPSEQAQIEYLNQTEDADLAPSVFRLPQEVADQFLIHGSNSDFHRMAIVSEFSKNRPEEQLEDFLRGLYHGGNGIVLGSRSYACWYAYDGIHIASGHAARYVSSVQIVTWKQAAERIQTLLSEGTFASKLEASEAPGYERRLLAEKLWYLSSDLSEAGIQQNLLPTIRNLHGGFPTETSLLASYLQDTASIQKISQEMADFLKAYEADESILRFHYHNPQLLKDLVSEQINERSAFQSVLTDIPEPEQFITEDEIEASFARGSGVAGGKDRIYRFFADGHTPAEQASLLKQEYGTGGRSHALSDSSGSEESHDSKGIVLKKKGCEDISLTWEKAARRISDMIRHDRYLSLKEQNEMGIPQAESEPEITYTVVPNEYSHSSLDRMQILELLPDVTSGRSLGLGQEEKCIRYAKDLNSGSLTPEAVMETLSAERRKWHCYIIPDIVTWNPVVAGDRVRTPIEYFDSYEQAKDRFLELRSKSYLMEDVANPETGEPLARLTFGIQRDDPPSAADLIHVRDNQNYLVDDFTRMTALNTSEKVMEVIQNLHRDLGFDRIRVYQKDENGIYLPPENLAFEDWENPYFPKEPEISETQKRTTAAMKAAGFNRSGSESEIQFSDAAGYPLDFASWEEAYSWLDSAPFRDTPQIRTAVQSILHTDQEYAEKHLIPGETTFQWEGRTFLVDQVSKDFMTVDLQDVTFQNAVGFPIFRTEHIETVRAYLESVEHISQPQIVEEKPPVSAKNFHIIDAHLGEGGPKSKFSDNLRAIQLLKVLEADGRQAQPDEQEVLSRYVGWGGLPDAFDPEKKDWQSEYTTLKETLTQEEYESARASTLNAHYTSPAIIRSVYQAVENMGFEGGNILEPAMGIGNFFGMLPPSMESSKLYGVELDSVSGRIARQLYPQADITVAGFETTDRPDFYDLVVGNVPFGNYSVNDRAYNKHGFSIHNYFIAKSINQVRPGGVVAVLTSRYTMDAKNSSPRRYMAERAELLGAIRLPNNAFKANAGAEVVSDILFLQKREQPMAIEPDWVQSAPNAQGHRVNQYFLRHPEMVLGRQTEHTTAHGMDYTVEPLENLSLEQALSQAVAFIGGSYRASSLPDLSEDISTGKTIPADPNVKNYSYAVVDGTLYYRENSIMAAPDLPLTQIQRIKGLIEVRQVLNELIAYQLEDYPDIQIQEKQTQLNAVYDSFSKKYGLINSKANEKVFSRDSSYYLLASLEHLDQDGNLEKKADMFYKRTIRANHPVERVDTPGDALTASLGEKGRVDLTYMSRLLGGESADEITSALQGAIYRDPSLPEESQWVTADEYLSGNVRLKLRQAEIALRKDPDLAVNVKALQEAQPKPLEAAEIDVRLGASWIDPEYFQQFMHETFQTPYYRRYKVRIEYSPVTGEWRVGEKGVGWGNDVMATSTFGTTRATAYQILEDSLNLRDVRVNDYIEIDGKKKTVLNQRETTLAAQKQQAIADAFSDWIWKDPQRRNTLVEKYNELFNSNRPREYDGSHIVFAGINPEISLREHQKNAISHIMKGGNTLLAHEVGAGKTYAMIAAAMESKRLGLCEKSLFVVPNHLTLQWANDFLRLYPAANILVTSKRDFEPANRKKFCARIATGDYDAVIIGHSQFEMIPVSTARQKKTIEDQLQEIEDAIYEQRWSGKNFTIKQLEKAKKSLEAKLEKLMANDRKDDVVTFEQLGVDRLFVDESQAYKNLYFHTKMRNIAGLSTSESQRSTDMFMKCRYMDELTGNRGVIFASGTPVSNSMAEMYTLMRYLQYDTLQTHGLSHFDNWAATFGETVTAIELAPEGYTQLRR